MAGCGSDECNEGNERSTHSQVAPVERVDGREEEAQEEAPDPRLLEDSPPQSPETDRRQQVNAEIPRGSGVAEQPSPGRFVGSQLVRQR